jgi:lysozyme
VIYTSHHFYRTKFQGKFPGYKFWIANYNPQVSGMEDPNIICWQHSDEGSVPGIAGPVDMNFTKIVY